ncbi:hypothetical protein RB195_013381 [Necator americanus]|uniref:C3H1-type domain-containing protein n=1 Tax=Necator americanus TaxID=51031 RepID=A0ABR1DVB5_NECAM
MSPPAIKSGDTARPDMVAADRHHSTSSANTSGSRGRPPREQSNCFLHDDDHYTSDCQRYTSLGERCMRIAGQGRCLRCLYLHTPGQCCRERLCGICSSS